MTKIIKFPAPENITNFSATTVRAVQKILKERTNEVWKKYYSSITFNEFINLVTDWGLREAKERQEVKSVQL